MIMLHFAKREFETLLYDFSFLFTFHIPTRPATAFTDFPMVPCPSATSSKSISLPNITLSKFLTFPKLGALPHPQWPLPRIRPIPLKVLRHFALHPTINNEQPHIPQDLCGPMDGKSFRSVPPCFLTLIPVLPTLQPTHPFDVPPSSPSWLETTRRSPWIRLQPRLVPELPV